MLTEFCLVCSIRWSDCTRSFWWAQRHPSSTWWFTNVSLPAWRLLSCWGQWTFEYRLYGRAVTQNFSSSVEKYFTSERNAQVKLLKYCSTREEKFRISKRPCSVPFIVIYRYDLARAKSEALDNIYSLFKQNIKSRNAKRRRQHRRTVKNNNRSN